MMLVILRDGTERLYPSATYCDLSTSVWSFYTTKGGTWLASFPQDFVALVDSANERGRRRPVDPDAALACVTNHIYEYTDDKHRPDLTYIKRALQGYSIRAGWKVADEQPREEEEP
jgi:hypothetical protein